MCSIAGEINFKNGVALSEYHIKMKDALAPRGPDEGGAFQSKNCIFLHKYSQNYWHTADNVIK